jgi:hypothetical protein
MQFIIEAIADSFLTALIHKYFGKGTPGKVDVPKI